jgi:hypothetical protein
MSACHTTQRRLEKRIRNDIPKKCSCRDKYWLPENCNSVTALSLKLVLVLLKSKLHAVTFVAFKVTVKFMAQCRLCHDYLMCALRMFVGWLLYCTSKS